MPSSMYRNVTQLDDLFLSSLSSMADHGLLAGTSRPKGAAVKIERELLHSHFLVFEFIPSAQTTILSHFPLPRTHSLLQSMF